MRQIFFSATIVGILGALPLYAQDNDANTRAAQATEPETGETSPEGEARPQERDIIAMADGGEWVEEYVSEDGEELYQTLCSGCHMADGSGAIGAGKYPALSGNPNLEYAGYATYIIINGQAAMPSLEHFLDNQQVLAITDYIQTNLGNDYEADGTLDAVADARPAEPVNQNTEEHE
ncbi:c-type cytochrome [Sulfitobacter sp. CS16]|uniref:c-type cytochrome n=1 Tax=Sulfitobacter sp. CS16 TaxID=3368573 RepID=UPI0037454933